MPMIRHREGRRPLVHAPSRHPLLTPDLPAREATMAAHDVARAP